jgi:acetylornithine deacetylase/succinyl-diaminopimelate desuccinylase-like protein
MIHGPVVIDAEHDLVRASRRALIDSGRPDVPLTVFPAWTDASLLSREGGIPSIIWGPGELDYAHSPEESITTEDVLVAADLYTRCARNFTGSTG